MIIQHNKKAFTVHKAFKDQLPGKLVSVALHVDMSARHGKQEANREWPRSTVRRFIFGSNKMPSWTHCQT